MKLNLSWHEEERAVPERNLLLGRGGGDAVYGPVVGFAIRAKADGAGKTVGCGGHGEVIIGDVPGALVYKVSGRGGHPVTGDQIVAHLLLTIKAAVGIGEGAGAIDGIGAIADGLGFPGSNDEVASAALGKDLAQVGDAKPAAAIHADQKCAAHQGHAHGCDPFFHPQLIHMSLIRVGLTVVKSLPSSQI